MMGYKHVVFDIDGTLADSEEATLRSLQQVVRERTGRTVPLDDLAFALGIPGSAALRKLGIEPDALARWSELERGLSSTVKVFDGVWLALAELDEAGFELGIVSSRVRGEYKAAIEPLGFTCYFGTVVLAEDSRDHKPAAGPMRAYLEKSGASPADVLYVGDTAYDCQCAHAAGVDFALAEWGARPGVAGADWYCRQPTSVIDVARFGEHD